MTETPTRGIDIIIAIATAVMAIATIASVYVIWMTDKTARSANRAFVYFDMVRLRPYPDPPIAPGIYGVEIVVTNSGNTPAHQTSFKFACPHPGKGKDPFDLVNWDRTEVKPPLFLGPKQTLTLQACNLSLDEIFRTKNGEIATFVVAQVHYIDAFSAPRVTRFSQRLQFDKEGGHSLAYIGANNCSDENCPKGLTQPSRLNLGY